jgi:hypothetical protein
MWAWLVGFIKVAYIIINSVAHRHSRHWAPDLEWLLDQLHTV